MTTERDRPDAPVVAVSATQEHFVSVVADAIISRFRWTSVETLAEQEARSIAYDAFLRLHQELNTGEKRNRDRKQT